MSNQTSPEAASPDPFHAARAAAFWRDIANLRDLLAWIAVLTAILPTFVAMRQNDARLLLGWHGIGQGGYMLLGLILADSLGSAGGLLHVFNYATYQAILLMAVFAVIHRTGTADLNRLGGLVARDPVEAHVGLAGDRVTGRIHEGDGEQGRGRHLGRLGTLKNAWGFDRPGAP